MSDAIDRQAAIDAIHGAIIDFFDICDDDEESPITYKDEQLLKINKAISGRIKQLPSAQPEQKKGKWIPVTNGRGGFECDECHNYAPSFQDGVEWLSDYCPNCGADMRGE